VIDVFPFSGMPVAVMGLGKSGLATAEALRTSGAEVWAWDDSEARRNEAKALGFEPADLTRCDWNELTTLVLSPGIPHSFPKPHPVAALAKQHKVEIIGDIELLGRSERLASYFGITGTNGKSTTTALIGHILRSAGKRAAVGGNIGTPVLSLTSVNDGIYVLEMSSYQLELTVSITFDVAVLLNISPDHLDRHGGMDGYVAAKRQIFHRQTTPRTAVIGVDDDHCRKIHADLVGQGDQIVIPISAARPIDGGVYGIDGVLFDAIHGPAVPVADLKPISTLPGAHNWQNAAAAYAACRAIGIAPETIAAALATYPGLPHRQELVAIVDDIPFVNDSKATNADAAAKALACYDAIYWIAGGLPKEGGIASLVPFFPRIRRAYLIGQAAPDFARTLGTTVPHEITTTLAAAVAAAHRDARADKASGAVVLLSPACASFDQFPNFEARGDTFRQLALALPNAHKPSTAPTATGGRA
jgi:UDP-N-acetylmuramoylalanine--D-glutamate ligase